MNRWGAVALLLAVAGALALRLPDLGLRPLHNDEGVNAFKLAALWERGEYRYDPHEYHGPTLHYFSLPILALSGVKDANQISDALLRLTPVIFGVALLLLLPLLADALGRMATVWAAAFTAISPGMVFYSRYFIHETLLVCFGLLVMGAAWRYLQSRKIGWVILTGAGVGLMHATKETFVFTLAAMMFGGIATMIWETWQARRAGFPAGAAGQLVVPITAPGQMRAWVNWRHVGAALATGVIVSLLLFSSFLANLRGPLDSILTYVPWLHRAGGASPHIHPWYFYLERILWHHAGRGPVWSEALIVGLAAYGAVVSLTGNLRVLGTPRLGRFLTFYTLALIGLYSLISYKTPWCLLGFLHGLILLAGIGAAGLLELCRGRTLRRLAYAALVAGGLHLAWQARELSTSHADRRLNPYAYSQTVRNVRHLVSQVEGIAGAHADHRNMVIKVISPESYWPLPWYLRGFQQVGWWDAMPDDPYAPVILVSSSLDVRLDEKSDRRWVMTGLYELRPGMFLELYVEMKLWQRYVASRPRPED